MNLFGVSYFNSFDLLFECLKLKEFHIFFIFLCLFEYDKINHFGKIKVKALLVGSFGGFQPFFLSLTYDDF